MTQELTVSRLAQALVASAGEQPAIILGRAERSLSGLLATIGFRVIVDRRASGGLLPRAVVWTAAQRDDWRLEQQPRCLAELPA